MPENKTWFTMKKDEDKKERRAKIKIHDEIGMWGKSYKDFAKELDDLGELDALDISINSPGGEVFDGFAIYNTLIAHKAQKNIKIEGVAASVSSIIAMAGNTITMPRNAYLMIHNPMLFTAGDAKDLRHAADLLDKVKNDAIAVYKRRAKDISDKELSDMMDDETWMNGEEAKLKGFADVVETDMIEPEEEVRIDNRFKKVPVACMCFFKNPKNTGDETGGKQNSSDPVTGNNSGTGDGNGDGNAQNIDDQKTEPAPSQAQPQQKGVIKMAMTTKEIVAKTLAGKNKIDGEIKNALALAKDKIDESKIAELTEMVNKDVSIDCEDPEQIEAKADQIVSSIKAKSSEFILKNLIPVPQKPKEVSFGVDEQEKFCNVAKTVLFDRAGIKVEKNDLDDARKNGFGQMGLQSFCREILARNGVRNAMHIPAGQVYDEMCRVRSPRMGNAQGSGDFSNVFADVANKVLARAWETAPTTYQAWVANDTIPDFRTKNIVRVSEMGDVLEMKEGEGFPYTSMKDSKETASLLTVGVAWGISRKAIINDDLNMLTVVPDKLARSIRRYVNRAVYTGLYGTNMAGPTMTETGYALISSNHANYVADTSGAAPSTATLATLRQKMMKQTLPTPDGSQSKTQYTNIPPKFILYHSDHDIVVHQLITSTYDITSAGSLASNIPFIQSLTPVWDPILDELMAAATDPHTGWYLIADPADIQTVCVYTLTGQTMPTLRQKVSDVAEPLGTTWDIYYDVGIGYPDYRGIAANYGE